MDLFIKLPHGTLQSRDVTLHTVQTCLPLSEPSDPRSFKKKKLRSSDFASSTRTVFSCLRRMWTSLPSCPHSRSREQHCPRGDCRVHAACPRFARLGTDRFRSTETVLGVSIRLLVSFGTIPHILAGRPFGSENAPCFQEALSHCEHAGRQRNVQAWQRDPISACPRSRSNGGVENDLLDPSTSRDCQLNVSSLLSSH